MKSTTAVFRLACVVLAMAMSAPVRAQHVTGTLGSPSATITLKGNQLPPEPPKFGGVIKETPPSPSPGGRHVWCRPRARPTCC